MSKFQLYIEAQTMTQCGLCRNFKIFFLFKLPKAKKTFLYWVCGHVVREMYLTFILKTNPFDIRVPCVKIAKSELLFEKYRMIINWDKYNIEVLNDDAIKRN